MILAISAAAAVLASAAAAAQPVGLAEAARRAVERAAQVQAAEAGRRQAEEAAREASRSRLPSLYVRAGASRGDHPVYAFGEVLTQRRLQAQDMALGRLNSPGYVTSLAGGLEVGVPLFTAFQLETRRRWATLSASQAGFGREAAEQELRASVVEAFTGALSRARLAEALAERLASSSKQLDDARRLKDRGLILGSDYFAAEAVRAGLAAWAAAAARELEGALAVLSILAGSDVRPAGRLAAADYAIEADPDLVRRAFEGRAELKAASVELAKAAALRREAGASWLPRVEAFAALNADTHDASYLATNRTAGVRASLPLGDPGYRPRVDRAEAAAAEADARRRGAEDQVRVEVAQAAAAYRGLADALPELRRMREHARESLDRVRPLYKEGRQSVLDVLRAEEALARSEDAVLTAEAGLHAAYARVLRASGRLDAEAVRLIAARLEARP